jgi:glycosyltransferase involved in cell wall biosynthesis
MSSDPAESVSAVNRAFLRGLADRYNFSTIPADRTMGTTRQAKLNVTNGFYFASQFVRWTTALATHRPALAHYAVSSGWGMEKGLAFLQVARMFGARTLAHLHSGAFIDHWQSLPAWRRARAAKQFARLDGLVLASDWWREQIANHVPLPADRLFTVNNPLDPDFEKAALEMSIAERDGITILAMGVMGRPKGIFEIVQAAKLVADLPFKFVIAGGEREPNIARDVRDFISSNQLSNVELLATIDNAQKLELFRKASVLLLPSYYENFPLVVLEAAAAAHAIVTTPVGAVPEFFADASSALFVRPREAGDIAAALRRLQQPGERVRLATASRDVFVNRLTRSRIMDSLDSVYRRVLKR